MQPNGLTSAEVEQRVSAGQVNGEERKTRNTFFDILFRNITAPLNLVLIVLGVMLIVCHDIINAIAACGIMFINVIVSTAQEYKAKRRLEKISLLVRPSVAVVRDGTEIDIDRAQIVIDDVIHLRQGDQAQVDGVVISSRSVEMDESLLTGESRTVRKAEGDPISSGSSCVQGECYFRTTAVGEDTFSSKMTAAAKRFEKKNTPIQKETAAITKFLMAQAVIMLIISVVKTLIFAGQIDLGLVNDALKGAVIILDIIPIALFLFVTITYMISSVRMADSGVLLQNPASVESMSHVDTLCMDKTGTITTNRLIYEDAVFFGPEEEASALIRRMCASVPSMNRTLGAVCDHFGKEECELLGEIQFSSQRKFSAVTVRAGTQDTVFAGAWNVLGPHCTENRDAVDAAVKERSSKGLRTLVFCRSSSPVGGGGDDQTVPDLVPLAVVSIRDEVRPDCRETIGSFIDNGVEIKVISGDDPETVRQLFDQASIPGEREIISGDEIDSLSGADLDRAVLRANIFGRMRPEQKETVIESLRRSGRYVAMVGDGVNDVRPIKKADVGVAMESGAGAARGVADMILIKDNFSALSEAVYQGKRTVSGMRDILRFYITRNIILAILVLICLVILGNMPMEPIQNTFWALLSVSIPTLIITFWAKATDEKGSMIPNIVRYSASVTLTSVLFFFGVFFAVYYMFDNGIFSVENIVGKMAEAMDSQWFDGLKTINGYDLTTYDGLAGFITSGHPDQLPYYFARNAALVFLIGSGIMQLILLFPPHRRLCWDRYRPREVVPLVIFFLMFGLLAAGYVAVPFALVSIVQMVLFDWGIFAFVAQVLLVWYAVTLLMLRSRMAARLGDRSQQITDRIMEHQEKVRKRRHRSDDDE